MRKLLNVKERMDFFFVRGQNCKIPEIANVEKYDFFTFRVLAFLPVLFVVDDDGTKPLKLHVPKMANCSRQIPKPIAD